MEFKVKTVAGKDLEKTLNEYEPHCLKLFTILPNIYIDEFDRHITDYKIVYTVVPEEDLRELILLGGKWVPYIGESRC